MKIRLALLAFVITSALVALLALSATPQRAHADESGARPTPTPDRPLDAQALSPDHTNAPEAELPDLVVTDIRVLPNPPVVNEPVTVEVTIANSGTLPIPAGNNFFVDLYINPLVPPGVCSVGHYSWSVQATSLAQGPVTLRVTLAPGTPAYPALFEDVGLVRFWAQVDTCGNVAESREDNNRRAAAVDFTTHLHWLQTTLTDFHLGFSSALDLTNTRGVLQNGTGWFEEPRFPRPEEESEDWPINNEARPWNSPDFYNPDRHIFANNLPANYPRDQLHNWNPPDQENVDIQVGFTRTMLFAVWEDARNGDLNDRDIYISRSLNGGKLWQPAVRVNQDALGNGRNQLNPQLAIDRQARRLYVFWEDNRRGNSGYDIFFARSDDNGRTWEEPDSNPVNDFNINPAADQINVTVSASHELLPACGQYGGSEETTCPTITTTQLFVAWEDYRNGNADIFFEWSGNGGDSWLKSPGPMTVANPHDAANPVVLTDPSTLDANIWVQPDPRTNAGAFEQRDPHLSLERAASTQPIDYCLRDVREIELEEGGSYNHYYVLNPLPRVFIVWEDEREIESGDPSDIYYTRGEFNYLPEIRNRGRCNPPPPEAALPQGPEARPNLPPYRFEDDHVAVSLDDGTASQSNPVAGFADFGFLTNRLPLSYVVETETPPVTVNFFCELKAASDEVLVSWEDTRDGRPSIYAVNIFDDLPGALIVEATGPVTTDPAGRDDLYDQEAAQGLCEDAVSAVTDPRVVRRNRDSSSPQPEEFYELAFPELPVKASEGVTFIEKPLCQVPGEPIHSLDPSEQTQPDLAVIPLNPDILNPIDEETATLVTRFWTAWGDTRASGEGNQDILLRPLDRVDFSRTLTTTNPLQVVQNNVKNQIMLREWDLYEDYVPANVEQSNPSIAFHTFDAAGFFQYDADDILYVGWDDNRNANPLIGFESNRDVFAARMHLTVNPTPLTPSGFPLRPTRTAAFVSSVFDAGDGQEVEWYDIEWIGDISVDGVVTLQTRFGMDPNQPEPPQENIAANGWTQWTGIGGTGGFYTGPGQHITGPDGEKFPRSYYIQYRVNFNPLEGQEGISCLGEIKLNYERITYETYLPMVLRNTQTSGQGTIEGTVTNAVTGDPLGAAQICEVTTNQCTTSDFNGRYTLPVPVGPRRVRATLAGYLPVEQSVEVGTGPPITVNFQLSSGTGTVEGQVVNAVTGGPLGGVNICLADTDQCATSGSDGRYTFTNLPAATQRLRASLSGYVTLDQSVTVTRGAAATLNFALSPVLPAGEMRVVLTWGERPSDLDSHLWLPTATPYHVLWTDRGRCDAFPHACLDVDDTTSFGPETTTIRQRSNGTYVFAIYQYTTDGPLTASGARVQVYASSGLVAEYAVPTAGDGRWWHVFDMDGATGNITPRNIITNTSPGPYDPGPSLVTNGRERAKE
jgi:hypothetical protein